MAEQLRLMAVHAHPDDESSKGAATMAQYVAEGVEVLVVTCTGGERGSVLNPKMDRPEVLGRHRRHPPRRDGRAREILGVDQAWLGLRRLRACPRATRCRRCPRAVSPCGVEAAAAPAGTS